MNPAHSERPSAVSGRIVGQHHAVQTQLDELSLVAKTLLTEGPAALKYALELTRTLCDDLTKHITLEAKILLPALRNADAWGKIRGDTLSDRLRTRRQELKHLRRSCANEPGAPVRLAIASSDHAPEPRIPLRPSLERGSRPHY